VGDWSRLADTSSFADISKKREMRYGKIAEVIWRAAKFDYPPIGISRLSVVGMFMEHGLLPWVLEHSECISKGRFRDSFDLGRIFQRTVAPPARLFKFQIQTSS